MAKSKKLFPGIILQMAEYFWRDRANLFSAASLLPENIGLTDTDLAPLFRSAEDYTQTRKKCVSRSKAL